jgi:protease YdgD
MKLRVCLCRIALVLTLTQGSSPALTSSQTEPSVDLPVLPGVGPHDPRTRVDPNRPPWRAVGKLQATAGSLRTSCTGTLIGPFTVLTAAHCLFNIRTRRYFPSSSLFFLIGFEGERYAGHARVRAFTVGPGYDPIRPLDTIGSDWALVTIDARLGTPDRILGLRDRQPDIGTQVMIGGYGQDHPYALAADSSCRIVGAAIDRGGQRLLRHDCTATRGVSGAPVLVQEGGVWRVGGIDVAAQRGAAKGLAVILDAAAQQFHPLP